MSLIRRKISPVILNVCNFDISPLWHMVSNALQIFRNGIQSLLFRSRKESVDLDSVVKPSAEEHMTRIRDINVRSIIIFWDSMCIYVFLSIRQTR